MIRKIADLIVDELSGLNFVDLIGGVVSVVEVTNKQDENVLIKKVPAITDKSGNYTVMIPDSSKKAVIYFEDNGVDEVENNRRYTSYQASLRLVAWYNLPKINDTYTRGDLLTQTLKYTIPHELPNTDYLTRMHINFDGQTPRDKNIFGAYDYNEAELQYLNYPYDYAALDFTVLFSVPRNAECFDDIIINPGTC